MAGNGRIGPLQGYSRGTCVRWQGACRLGVPCSPARTGAGHAGRRRCGAGRGTRARHGTKHVARSDPVRPRDDPGQALPRDRERAASGSTCSTRVPEPDPDEDLLPRSRQDHPASETVRGYEWSKGQYVVVDEEDFEAVPLKTMRAIEIEMFVNARRDDAGPVRQAGVLPRAGAIGAKAFYLLESVLAERASPAICKIVLKDREAAGRASTRTPTRCCSRPCIGPTRCARSTSSTSPRRRSTSSRPSGRWRAARRGMTGEFDADDYQDEYRAGADGGHRAQGRWRAAGRGQED